VGGGGYDRDPVKGSWRIKKGGDKRFGTQEIFTNPI